MPRVRANSPPPPAAGHARDPGIRVFLRIVEKPSLAAAGRELGLSAASVSERLVALEKYYGAALLNRTTRAISLTDEGRLLVQGGIRLLAEADELEALIRLGMEKISGPIRLSAPIDLGRSTLVPILDAFLVEHPEVTIDLNLTDGYVDFGRPGTRLRHPIWRTGGQHLARKAPRRDPEDRVRSPSLFGDQGNAATSR
jgi:hypothetical protein